MRLSEFEVADSVWKRMRGLVFRRAIEKPLIFIFPAPSKVGCAIHSFFVFFPFDAVFLDEEKRVVDVRHSIRPFTLLIIPAKPAKYLVEMPAGMAKGNGLEVGEKISW